MLSTRTRHRVSFPVTLAAIGLAATTAYAQSPLPVTGFNADIVQTAGDTTAAAFDIPNNYSLYSNSFDTDGGGLPDSGAFTSATGTNNNYQLGSYNANNVLLMSADGTYSGTGQLTLNATSSYGYLGIISATTNAGTGPTTVAGVVHYTDGTTSSFQFASPDWYNTNGALEMGRIPTGSTTTGDTSGPGLNETVIAVTPGHQISNIVFTSSFNDSNAATGIFAVTGIASSPASRRHRT